MQLQNVTPLNEERPAISRDVVWEFSTTMTWDHIMATLKLLAGVEFMRELEQEIHAREVWEGEGGYVRV